MLQDMDNMEASCIFYVKVGTFTQLEQSEICLLTVNETGIIWLTVQHDCIIKVSFMCYPGDYLRQTSANILSLEEWPIYIWQQWDFGSCTVQLIPGNKHTSDRLIANRGMLGNPCNLQSYAAGFMLSIMNKLAATYSILTWSSLYIPQDFQLHFVIIFFSYSTPSNHGYTTTSARWLKIRNKQIDGRFIQYVTHSHTARTQTPVSPLWRCQWSHQKNDPGCTFENHP